MGGAEPRAAPRAWRAPDLPRSEHRGRLVASRVLHLALALLALFEAIAVAVHFKDVAISNKPKGDIPLTLVHQIMNTMAMLDTPLNPVRRTMDIRAARQYPPYPGSGYRYPVYDYPGDRASEDWSPRPGYPIEPSG